MTALEPEPSVWSKTKPIGGKQAGRSITRPSPRSQRLRTLRIGLLGCGNVGRAFVKVCDEAQAVLAGRGLRVEFTAALVRDVDKRAAASGSGPRFTSSAESFFREPHDLVIEALGGVEPARSLIERCLLAEKDVVTANKAVIARHGPHLERIAASNGVGLRYEASTVAGIPFLTLLRSRPLAASARRVCGILNGTSNFILSRMAHTGCTIADALSEARRLGLAEPDASYDSSGRDAAAKLVITLRHLGVTGVQVDDVDRTGIDEIDTHDIARAKTLGGTIKPVAYADIAGSAVAAFVGPAFVPIGHPLYGVEKERNAVCFSGGIGGPLVLTGAGAGPDVTAATLLDDVIELAESGRSAPRPDQPISPFEKIEVCAPDTAWFLRVRLKDASTPYARIPDELRAHGIATSGLVGAPAGAADRRVYLKTQCIRTASLASAIRTVDRSCNCTTSAIRIAPDA